jgi:hypothetical protein
MDKLVHDSKNGAGGQITHDNTTSNRGKLPNAVNPNPPANGKHRVPHYHASEMRLVILAFAGGRTIYNSDSLSLNDQRLLELLEQQNAVLLGQGKPPKERKAALFNYARSHRQQMSTPANDSWQRIA